MASVNRVIIVGNLGRDPEIRYAPSGDAITNIAVATTDQWKDKSGEKQERTEWHRVVFFGRQAGIAGEYLKKGSQVYVEGSLRTRKWTDQQGQERYTTEIVADRMQMLGNRSSGANADNQATVGGERKQYSGERQQEERKGPPPAAEQEQYIDDIPFASGSFAMDVIGCRLHRRLNRTDTR